MKEDEWLCYSFGYDRRKTDHWIVERNSSDRVSRPLWIGSECRSVFVSGENRRDFVRSFDHYQLSFAWDNFSDDPEIYTKLQGRLGLFQLLA